MLHDSHNDFPLAVEHIKIDENMLSPYNKDLLNHMNSKHTKMEKLLPNFYDKKRYIFHYRNL